MPYRTLFHFYLDRGGDTSRETTLGDRHWDDAGDPDRQRPLRVVLNHDTGDVRAEGQDGRIVLVDTVTATWGPEETVKWLYGDDRPRPLSWFRETVDIVNRCSNIQDRLAELPRAIEGETCTVCGGDAHVHFRSQPRCEDCMVTSWGSY